MKNNKRYFVYGGIVVVLIIGLFSINLLYKDDNTINNDIAFVDEVVTTTNNTNTFYVDIKGAVKKPGVYQVNDSMIVNDLIKLAGGLNKNAYTKNINLATKLKEGMVIYIYNKNELTNSTSNIIKSDITCTTQIIEYKDNQTTSVSDGLININTASKEDLMTLTGIGESKAIAIIEYRNKTPFKTIEDLMNVSGIGESAFAKIKSSITV